VIVAAVCTQVAYRQTSVAVRCPSSGQGNRPPY